jgi:hypothetical protein
MYRAPAWIEEELERVLSRHEASVGYSTCLWHNVRTSVSLIDPMRWFADLQKMAARPYPEPLRRAIIAKSHPILRRSMTSFLHQIERGLDRGDTVAVQHRLAALLACYFDVLFALNRQTHPGEKRLLPRALALCPLRPAHLERQVAAVLAAPLLDEKHQIVSLAHQLIDGLDDQLIAEGLI